MNKEQEIEIIRKVLENSAGCDYDTDCSMLANDLVNVGIGDKKQAVKEFCEKLKNLMSDKCFSLIGRLCNDYIDELFTELYGADE